MKLEMNSRFAGFIGRLTFDDSDIVVLRNEVVEISEEQLTECMLLSPQLLIDGETYETRMGLPEHVPQQPSPGSQAVPMVMLSANNMVGNAR